MKKLCLHPLFFLGLLIRLALIIGMAPLAVSEWYVPFLVKWSKIGEHHCAVRVSEFESIETALTLAGKVDWVWVDCFTKFPLIQEDAVRLKNAGFKLCLVSPELQGRNAEIEIPALVSLLRARNIESDAVCTKRPDLWEKMAIPQ